MQQTKSLSLSDFIRNPGSFVEDFVELPEDDDVEYVKEYGIGIDCHLKFIEVCVRYRNADPKGTINFFNRLDVTR